MFTLNEIYRLVGRDDKVAIITFSKNTSAFNHYGKSITVIVSYTLFEREKREKEFTNKVENTESGIIKLEYLGDELSKEKIKQLIEEGINSEEIEHILPSWPNKNLFYENRKREMRAINIDVDKMPKGAISFS